MSENVEPSSTEAAVGYGKPPKAHQFKKGRSGNPKGRPKREQKVDESFGDIFKRLFAEEVEVKINGKVQKMTKREYAALRCINKAMEGDVRTFMKIEETLSRHEEIRGNQGRGGVLVVPGLMENAEKWAELASAHQAPHRGNVGEEKKAPDGEIIRKK